MEKQDELNKGDSVRMHGQACVGEIVGVTDQYAMVAFQFMKAKIPLRKLEKILPIAEAGPPTFPIQPTVRILNLASDAFFSFNTEIDLHGMTVPSALSVVEPWIDKASLLGHKQLKIIHGKGTGALRSAIRTYLQSHSQIKRIIDKHPYSGGEGVTWVEVG